MADVIDEIVAIMPLTTGRFVFIDHDNAEIGVFWILEKGVRKCHASGTGTDDEIVTFIGHGSDDVVGSCRYLLLLFISLMMCIVFVGFTCVYLINCGKKRDKTKQTQVAPAEVRDSFSQDGILHLNSLRSDRCVVHNFSLIRRYYGSIARAEECFPLSQPKFKIEMNWRGKCDWDWLNYCTTS